MSFDVLPYTPLTKQQKAKYEEIMRTGAERLKFWHGQIAPLRGKKKYSRANFRSDLFARAAKKETPCFEGVCIPQADITKIMAVREIEWPVLCGYSRMVGQQAKRWSLREHDAVLDFDDLYSEGITALSNAIYHYNSDKVQFSTFAHHSINRRMITVCTRSNPLSPRSNNGSELYQKYEIAKRNFNGPATFEEIVERMDLSPKELSNLQSLLVKVVPSSVLVHVEQSGEGDEDNSADYTFLASAHKGYSVSGHHAHIGRVFRQEPHLELDQWEAVDKADLNEFERAVLNCYLESPEHGWQTEFAKTHTNPDTGKPYSRMAISYAIKRVRDKILRAYSPAEAAAAREELKKVG